MMIMPAAATAPGERVLAIVPTYEEATTLPALLASLLALPDAIDVLIVDDASPDGTQAVVRSHADFDRRVFLHARTGKLGLASAYRAGFQWALGRDYDICLEMDADLSHDPRDVPRLIAAIHEGADLAIGSRYVDGIRVMNWPASRLLLSLFAGRYTRCLTGLPLCDPTSGFKAIRRRALESMPWEEFRSEGYAFQIELHFRAWREGFDLREVPIVFTERREGASKMSRQIAREAVWRVLALAWQRHGPRLGDCGMEPARRKRLLCHR